MQGFKNITYPHCSTAQIVFSMIISDVKGNTFLKNIISIILTKFSYIFCLIILTGSIGFELNAQLLPKIRFKNIDKTYGLPHNNVNAITRDNLGYMWFGTNDGLCRYETPGHFKVLRVDEKIKGGLKSANIRAIYIDQEDNIWIGTRLGGLTKYNQKEDTWETFTYNPQDPNSISNNEVLEIIEDNKGNIWVGTENNLNVFHPETKTFSRFKIDKKDPSALQTKAILSIIEDDKGWIWVGTWEGGLHLLLPSTDGNIAHSTFRHFNLSKKLNSLNVWKIFQDKQKRYWIGTHGDGLYLMQLPENASNDLTKQDWEPNFHNYVFSGRDNGNISSNMTRDIIQDSHNRIWIATVHGLNIIAPEELPSNDYLKVTKKKPEIKFDNYFYSNTDPNSLAHDEVSSIYEDEQGIIWLGTFSGVSKYNWYNNQFDNYEFFEDDFNAPNTQNIYISPEKVAWLATGNHGVLLYNFTTNEIGKIKESNSNILIDDYIDAIYSPDDISIYFASSSGVSMFNTENKKVVKYPLPEEIKKLVPNLKTYTLYIDKYNRIWLGTDRGLFWIDKETGKYSSLLNEPGNPNSISDNSISSLYLDSEDYLWVATFNGLNKFKIGEKDEFEIQSYKHDTQNPETSIPSNQLTELIQVNDILYIGTTNGLCGYDYKTETFINFSKTDNKFGVQSIEKTNNGNLWASTTEGIFYFDTQKQSFNIFEKGDGLGDIAFRASSSQMDKDGFIYFGNRRGITRLHPARIATNTVPPPVYITEIKKVDSEGKQVLNMTNKSEISIPSNNYYLSIDFSAVNYNSIEKNTYAYKLEGFEENWNYTNTNMSATYTNLKHGEYTFKVKAANNDGVWNENPTTLKIIKLPVLWERTYFRIVALLGLGALIWLSFFVYTRNIRHRNSILNKYNSELSREIKERKRIEKTLQEREQFLRLLMDNIPQHIYWIDKTHRLIGCNTSFLNGFQEKNKDEIIGRLSQDVFDTTAAEAQIDQSESEVLRTGVSIFGQVLKMVNLNTYEEIWMDKNYIPLKNEQGEIFGVLVTGENITARIQAEEVLKNNSKQLEIQVLERTQELGLKNKEIQTLLQSIEARNEELEEIVKQRTQELNEFNMELQQSNNDLGQFAYIASHDMKEPLRIIGNFAGLLSRKYKGKLDKSADEYIYYIEDGIKRMSALMDSLLTYSQVGKKEIELSKTNLNNILFAKLHDLSEVIKERNVEMQIDDLPEIYCEKEQIGMVFFNLINNGIKFNKSEKPVIQVKVHDDAPEGFWKFSVTDNGIGILPEFQSQIFEIFRRLHSKQEYKGTGIGLALTQKIVLRHGGTIKVLSIPAEGTTFVFTIAKAIIKESDGVQETVIRMNKSQDRIEQKYAFNKDK